MSELRDIENKLIIMVNNDKKNWVEFYLLMKEIEDKKLWKELGLNSFTAWVKVFCSKNKIHESIIWNRKKAGQVYLKYVNHNKEKGLEVTPIENTTVAVDTLVLIDKITSKSEKLGAELMDKAINKKIRKIDLRETYKAIREQEQRVKNEISQINYLNEEKTKGINSLYNFEQGKTSEQIAKDVLVAGSIITKLQKTNWLGVQKESKKHFISTYEQDKYEIFTDFKIFNPEKLNIEVAIAENLTTLKKNQLNLHGIIIKTNKVDLLNSKYINAKYKKYFNFVWLAIPEDLLELSKIILNDEIGIIEIKNEKLHIIRNAVKLHPQFYESTLTSIALKLLV